MLYEPTNKSMVFYGKLGTHPARYFWFRRLRKLPKAGDMVYVRALPVYGYTKWELVTVDKVDDRGDHYFVWMSR